MRRASFTAQAAGQVKEVARRVQGAYVFPPGAPPGGPRIWNPGMLDAIVTTAITSASGSKYGKGAAQIQIDTPNSGDPPSYENDPAYTAPVEVLCFSENVGTVAVGTHIGVYWRNGKFRLGWVDC